MSNKPEPAPMPSNGVVVWPAVIEDMKERHQIGTKKYGQPLTAGDGRKSLIDAYQEVLDMAVYLKKQIIENAELVAERDTAVQRAEYWKLRGFKFMEAVSLVGVIFSSGEDGISASIPRLSAQAEEIRALREALAFYAESYNWMGETLVALSDDMARTDGGILARAALAVPQPAPPAKEASNA